MKKKIFLSILLIISMFGIVLVPIKADSGWDSSYDSGGSWDSGGSDWGGSSWDSDYDYSYSGSYSSGSIGESIIIFIYVGIIIISIIYISSKSHIKVQKGNINNITTTNNYIDISAEKILEIDPDVNMDEFKTYAYNIYKVIQTAWMNFDTDTIRKFTTDEIYNMYSSQLETLKLKHQKNIMKNFECIDTKIIGINKENGLITINVYLRVKCLDYVINEKTKKTVRGFDNRRMDIEYELTFVKSETNNKDIEVCPNCGANVEITSSATCPYCDSVLVKDASKYVMSKKKCVGQRWC